MAATLHYLEAACGSPYLVFVLQFGHMASCGFIGSADYVGMVAIICML